ESPASLADPGPSTEAIVEDKEFSAGIYQILDELPDVYRSVITLVDLYELDYSETAKILKVPMGTVKSRVARARLQIKERLQGNPEYSGNFSAAGVKA